MAKKKSRSAGRSQSKTSKAKRISSPKKSWAEETQSLLNELIKKSKRSQVALYVFSQTGDCVLEAGKTKNVDRTSIGALVSSLRGIKDELNRQLKTKSQWALFDKDGDAFRVDYFKNWIIVAVRLPYSSSWKKLQAQLAKNKNGGGVSNNASEALSGLSEAAVDLALKPQD